MRLIQLKSGQKMVGTMLWYIDDIGRCPRKCLFFCECGNITRQALSNVRSRSTKSCGCYRRKIVSERNFKHGYSRTGAYSSWQSMHLRVKTDPAYKDRTICKRWEGENGFLNFLADMGERPTGKTLDRIKNNRGYYPTNCRWATGAQQARNKSNTRYFRYQGKRYEESELRELIGITVQLVSQRRRCRHMGLLESIITPIDKSKLRKSNK